MTLVHLLYDVYTHTHYTIESTKQRATSRLAMAVTFIRELMAKDKEAVDTVARHRVRKKIKNLETLCWKPVWTGAVASVYVCAPSVCIFRCMYVAVVTIIPL